MPNSCTAFNCVNRYKKGSPITFHKFPLRDAALLKLCLIALRREKWVPSTASRLCSEHFKSSDFSRLNIPANMRPESGRIDNRNSVILTRDENELIFRLLGNRCQTLATGVVQLFLTEPPDHVVWKRSDAGILCLVKDNLRRSYFFRLFCLTRAQMIWEHEVYNSMEYKSPESWFHTFEGEDNIVAFNFANEDDAKMVKTILHEKLEAKKRRLERRSRSSLQTSRNSIQSTGSGGYMSGGHMGSTSHLANGSLAPSPRQHHRTVTSGKKKEKDSKRRLTKADIGPPKDFRHISHVGWDPNKGFDLENVEDPQLKLFFDKAGVSDSQLQDRETREFIYDFINRHGGIDAVKDEVVYPQTPQMLAPPPVPARSAPVATNTSNLPYQTRSAPPPPPSRTGALPPPPPPSQPPVVTGPPPPPPPPTRTPQKHDMSSSQGAPMPPPPPPAASACAPPPPPPPMITPSTDSDGHQAGDTRLALMESIRSGKALKHVEVENKRPTSTGDSRGELLDQIRQGVELKSVQPVQKPAVNAPPQDGLAGALARALAERSRAIHSDTSGSSDDDDEEEDEEWED